MTIRHMILPELYLQTSTITPGCLTQTSNIYFTIPHHRSKATAKNMPATSEVNDPEVKKKRTKKDVLASSLIGHDEKHIPPLGLPKIIDTQISE